MQVSDVKAEPNPNGGRIDLSWTNPTDSAFGGVKVLRRESAFPGITDVGTEREVVDIPVATSARGALVQFTDENLKSERVYYYALVPYDLAVVPSSLSFASAMTTAPYQTAAHLYRHLPAIYRRYDQSRPPDVTALAVADREKGQLQRFVELFGTQFDLLRSFTSAMNTFSDRERIDGALLPLLASWIGWETNHALDLEKQRNEIQYAPHFYRTTGIPANLRANVNRLVTWDARIKEFVHNVFLSNGPEQLTVWEQENKNNVWQDPKLVSLDVAYEGRPATLLGADKRQWLFHHARQSAPQSADPSLRKLTQDHWHVWYKLHDEDEWLAARRVSFKGEINKYPAAVEDNDGRVWIFWTHYRPVGTASIPEIRLALLSAGQRARPARLLGTVKGPFNFKDGFIFRIKVTTAVRSFTREITFRTEYFQNIASATAAETAAFLDREIPDVNVTVTNEQRILFKATDTGLASQLEFPASDVAPLIGVTGIVNGTDAVAAELLSKPAAPAFALADGDELSIRIDDRISRVVTFRASDFADITQATPAEVAAAINRTLPGTAQVAGNRVKLLSAAPGESSSVVVEVFPSPLLSLALSFTSLLNKGKISTELRNEFFAAGITLSSAATVVVQTPGISWLITDGSRKYLISQSREKLDVYNPLLAAPKLGFGAPLPAPDPKVCESEPAVVKDNIGGLWLFWSSRRNGTWKIWFSRFDGNVWGAPKVLTTGADADREPAVLFVPADNRLWVFWSRKKNNGLWNIFFRHTTKLNFATLVDADWTQGELTPVPPNFDNREPNAIVRTDGAGDVELFFSSNRANGWHVWTRVVTTAAQGADTQLGSGQFTHRAPAVLKVTDQLKKLYFRSNESQIYSSKLYPAAETIDARYSGSTTVDTRNIAKISLRKNIKDVQHYTYDTLKTNENWYARDTVGVYLTPDTIDQALIVRRRTQIEKVLRKFLPIQVRTVFIVEQIFFEFVFDYDAPESAKSSNVIDEDMIDTILGEAIWGPLSDPNRGPTDTRIDSADFRWLRTFDAENKDGLLPDLTVKPPAFPFRLFLRDVAESGEE